MSSVIFGPAGPRMPTHPAVVVALCSGHRQAPYTDYARHAATGLPAQGSGQVEQVAESVPRVNDDQILRVQFRPGRVLRGPCVADAPTETGDIVSHRPPPLVIHALISPANCRRRYCMTR